MTIIYLVALYLVRRMLRSSFSLLLYYRRTWGIIFSHLRYLGPSYQVISTCYSRNCGTTNNCNPRAIISVYSRAATAELIHQGGPVSRLYEYRYPALISLVNFFRSCKTHIFSCLGAIIALFHPRRPRLLLLRFFTPGDHASIFFWSEHAHRPHPDSVSDPIRYPTLLPLLSVVVQKYIQPPPRASRRRPRARSANPNRVGCN